MYFRFTFVFSVVSRIKPALLITINGKCSLLTRTFYLVMKVKIKMLDTPVTEEMHHTFLVTGLNIGYASL